MKSYFLNLLGYDQYANKLMLGAITGANSPEKPVQLMAHLLNSQQVWLRRCQGMPDTGKTLWPDWQADAFEKIIDDNHHAWMDFLNTLQEEDIQKKIISYTNTKGDSYSTKLLDILTHMINHGTHHRAQAGQHLKLAGLEKLPQSDFIFYIRR